MNIAVVLLVIYVIGAVVTLRLSLNSWRRFGRDEIPFFVQREHGGDLDAYVRAHLGMCITISLGWPITVPLLLLQGETLPLRKPK